MNDDLHFSRLKRLVSIERVLQARELTAHLRVHGGTLVGPCPVHHGDNPRAFVVARDKGLWYCFTRCHRGGDVVDLVRALDHSGYTEAARYLATLAAHHGREIVSRCASRSFRAYSRALPLDHDAAFLAAKGIRADTAAHFEAGACPGEGWLHRCVAVRLHDPAGHPLGYAGRRLDPAEVAVYGKWKLPPGFPKNSTLYSFHRLGSELRRGVAVVECPWSVMRLHQIRVPAVALLGTSLSTAQLALLRDAPRLLLLMDGDAAGRSAALRLRSVLAGAAVSIAELPDRLDPDDLSDQQLCEISRPLQPRSA